MAREKKVRMNISRFLFAGMMCVNLLGAPALPQATSNQTAALAKQSSIVFDGTVSQLGATSFAGVPKSAQTIVVRVDSVLKKPPAVSLKKGDNVTVEVKDPSAFRDGTQATFYTDGWIFGSGVAVKELGHEIPPSGGAANKEARAGEKPHLQRSQQINDQDLQNRVNPPELRGRGGGQGIRRGSVPKDVHPAR